ncbi:MAG: tandem-95 repeat protein, partial [Acidobacteria bacterium]|nr:tandem-95 repeat protein [Acidobacteriota bacterium]
TTVLASGSASFPNNTTYSYLDGRTLILDANATYSGGPYYLNLYNGAVLQNAATFTITNDTYIYSNGASSPRIENSGTFQKSGGTGTSTIFAQLNNAGTVGVASGILALAGGGSGAGAFDVTSPGTLRFAGGTHALSGAFTSTGTIEVTTGTVNASGSFANQGLTSIPGGTLSLGMATASMQDLDLTGGTLAGTAQASLAGTMNWTSGTLGGTTIVEIAAAPAAVNLSGAGAKYLLGATIRNGGSGSWSGTGSVYGNQGGAIENLSGATLTRTDTGSFYYYCCTGAAPRFENQAGATFIRNGAGNSQFFSADVTNAGVVEVQAGTLTFYSSPFVQTAGSFSIAAGAMVTSNTGVDFQGGALMGHGTFTGNILNSGGSVRAGASPGILTIDGNYTQGSAGSLDVELGGLTAGTEFDQLNVTGTASLGGTLNVALLAPYVPADGDSYRILTFGSLASSPNDAFATANGTALGAGDRLQIFTDATFLDLVMNGNYAPTTVDDAVITPQDIPVAIDVLLNDSDSDGDTLTITGFTPASYGTAGCGTASCTYSPNPNFHGADSFTYSVSDGYVSSTATVTITVTPVNDAPVANPDSATTTADAPVVVSVLSNDTDVDGDPLTVTSWTSGELGSVTCTASGSCTYTPSGAAGTDTFTYVVSDGQGGTATGSVSVTVQPAPCPEAVVALSPSAGDEVEHNGILSWSGGSGADLFKVYLGPAGSGCSTLFG